MAAAVVVVGSDMNSDVSKRSASRGPGRSAGAGGEATQGVKVCDSGSARRSDVEPISIIIDGEVFGGERGVEGSVGGRGRDGRV